MDDEAWRRHANPWSVWTRFAALPALVLAVWSRAWIGWWALGPLAALVLWLLVNPRAFPPAEASRGWASKGIHGEALWFRHPDRVPPRHRAALRWPALPAAAGFAALCWGLARLRFWPTALGGTAIALAQLWRLHLLGRLHDEVARRARPEPPAG
jgi:hypothetical protein